MIPEYKLEGKIALITGAGRGIGKGIAEVLSRSRSRYSTECIDSAVFVKVAEQLAVRTGRRIIPYIADVTRSEQVEDLFARVMKDFGRLDILVNNLGDHIHKPLVPIPGQPGEPVTDEEIRKVIDINLTSAILCTRVVGPHFLQRRSGKVITISSFAALRAQTRSDTLCCSQECFMGIYAIPCPRMGFLWNTGQCH